MKLLEFCYLLSFILFSSGATAQTGALSGTWQLVNQSSCLDDGASAEKDSSQALREDMRSRSSATGQIITFKDNGSGEESTRILNSKKTANSKKFFYKFNGEMMLILDKKTQTISDSYMVDKFTADSLILSNAARPCETKIFIKINPGQVN